ncbi:MAG: hypothetical protein AAGG53_16555, partial [Cyanobacteria bacterium P01_H01_bin.152]
MKPYSSRYYAWFGLVSGLTLTFAAAPGLAQLEVTGGGATLNDVDVFVPTDGTLNNSNVNASDTRAVLYNNTLDQETLTIETNQGNIPADAIFRINTLPTIDLAGDGSNPIDANLPQNFDGAQGQILGTLSFRSVGPSGALFSNIPTTLNFQVVSPDTLAGGVDFTEYRAEGFILQETGFVTGASGVGAVVRQTPVTLVQYQDGDSATSAAADTQVLGNDVPASAYTVFRDGSSYEVGDVELSFDSGDIFTPPGFNLGGTVTDDASDTSILISRTFTDTSRVEAVSIFNQVAIINLPSFDDIIFDDDVVTDDDDSDDVVDDGSDAGDGVVADGGNDGQDSDDGDDGEGDD